MVHNMSRKKTDEEYKKELIPLGIVCKGLYIDNHTPIIHECPVCGKDWKVIPKNILLGKSKMCFNCSHNKLSEEYYKDQIRMNGIFLKDKYINIHTPVRHICPICNEDWLVAPSQILYSGVRNCWRCAQNLKESKLANILKQVCIHEDKSTIIEYDAGFRGKNGGISRYDIYIKSRNLLIECQSHLHLDVEHDKNKKLYAQNNGYKFLEIDNRDYSEIEAIQLIFPWIDKIPDYINFKTLNGSNNLVDKNIVQELLDRGFTYKEIAERLNTTTSIIDHMIQSKKVIRNVKSKGNRLDKYSSKVLAIKPDGEKVILDLSTIDNSNKQDYNRKIYIVKACDGKNAGPDGHYYNNIYFKYLSKGE